MAEHRRTLTLRLPDRVYEHSVRLAEARGESLNQFVLYSLSRTLEEERRARLFDSFTEIAELDETDVEFAAPAQGEVLDRADG